MQSVGYYNGRVGPLEEMTVPMNDRAGVFGDGVYEATTVSRYIPFALDEHIDRLYRSAALLRLSVGIPKATLRDELLRVTALLDTGESQLYWQLSRGTAMRGHAFPGEGVSPNLWITARPFTMRDPTLRYALLTVPDTRYLHCHIKTLNLLPNVMAAQQAKEAGCEEAVFHRDGWVTEGSHSNVHILRNGTLQTAPLNRYILPGITRAHILEICRVRQIPTLEQPFTVEEMLRADEVFFTSASAFCCAASHVDGQPVGGKAPALLQTLQNAYMAKFTQAIAEGVNPYRA